MNGTTRFMFKLQQRENMTDTPKLQSSILEFVFVAPYQISSIVGGLWLLVVSKCRSTTMRLSTLPILKQYLLCW